MNYKLFDLRVFGDERGKLISLEGGQGAGAFGGASCGADGANAANATSSAGGANAKNVSNSNLRPAVAQTKNGADASNSNLPHSNAANATGTDGSNSNLTRANGANSNLPPAAAQTTNATDPAPLPLLRGVPFEIKRVYWIFDTLPDFDRGLHAHRELEQVIVAMDGACEFVLDDGRTRESVRLDRPDRALYIGKNMWREMRHFSYGCKLMVLASEHYDEREYIRDYGEFLRGAAGADTAFKLADLSGGGGINALKLPFVPRRVFYIFETIGDVVRGCHANRDSEFVMFCIKGSCKVRVDDGVRKSEVVLSAQNGAPQNALWLAKMAWKEMFDFSPDAVLVVLTNTLYDEREYIRDYGEFLRGANA